MSQVVKSPLRPLGATELLALLMEVGEQITSTLDLEVLMVRIAELVKRVIDYKVFAILLLNEKTQELRIRSSVGHPEERVRKLRIKAGEGIVGRAALERKSVLVNDVKREPSYIESMSSIRSELAVPLILKNRVIGVIDLEADTPDFFTDQHVNLLELLAGRMAMAIENARLYRRSLRQSQTLQLLNEISRELSSVLVLSELLRKVGTLTKRLVNYHRFSIMLADEQAKTFNSVLTLRLDESLPDKTTVRFGQGIVGAAAASLQPVVSPDVSRDPRYILIYPDTKSEMAVPLIYRGSVIGVVDLESPTVNYFTEHHVRIFSTLAPQIAIAIENARLYERVLRSESRLDRDLKRAQEIQMLLMPGTSPNIPGLEVGLRFQPARQLGGDLYDFLNYGKERHVLAVGDVSGKGAPAALYGALAGGILRSLAPLRLPIPEMLRRLNATLLERRVDGHFITLVCVLWEPKTMTLRLANAGMPLPLLIRDGRSRPIQAEGVPLGLLEHTEYQETSLQLEKGDLLAFFSDGLVEAMNPELQEFGGRPLARLLRENAKRPLQEIVDLLFEEIARFEEGRPPRDDQTLVVARVR
ncbi:MAG TPA: SpoIIE family protein phosphatase [Terriglobia bacterium]|nr:SpoIIE family protein phosphatase [Terriglobia bacterium]